MWQECLKSGLAYYINNSLETPDFIKSKKKNQ